MNKYRRIAVIGSGVSGAVTAWILRDQADVALIEADARFGGHTHTCDIEGEDGPVAVDTGFMVFNRPNYPLLTALFEHLGVASYATDMSFSASFDQGRVEYAGSDLNTLFGQRRNLARPRFWRMLADIVRFNRIAADAIGQDLPLQETLGEFLDRNRLGEAFRSRYLYPMAAAIWSCPDGRIAAFPAVSFLRFFSNHGLIRVADRPQWETVVGGASSYMRRLVHDLGGRARAATPVARICRVPTHVDLVFGDGHHERYDDVVLACHADQALRLLDRPSHDERRTLGAIPYQRNRVLLHRDPALMPVSRRVWSSWNYLSRPAAEGDSSVSVTYWMNSLQSLNTRQQYFVSLNPQRDPDDRHTIAEFCYEHPVFGVEALRAQRDLSRLQGRGRTWYAGAWTGYGFHEDGIRSAVEAARAMGATVPWLSEVAASRAPATVGRQAPGRAA